jgi:RNA-binding protein
VALGGKAKRYLRGLAHDQDPVVMIGKDGVTDAIAQATAAALLAHELVKVKIHKEAPVDRHEAAAEVAAATGSELAGVIGRTFILYKRHPKKPKIKLPREPKAEARDE